MAGLGTVGAGTIKLLADQADLLKIRSGKEIRVTAVSARDRNKDRGINLDGLAWNDNAADLAADPNVDVV
ncbi:MAG: homoserine dehydrogenase, partial [Rhodospirillaceae bacterium]|nr:homoserine dehydrogenase [Rhodospirillaceae bacterium]